MDTGDACGSFREARCSLCSAVFYMCSRCDRGQVYCGQLCRDTGKRARRREAQRRYQQSYAGRRDHAARQANYRAKRIKQKVTHIGIEKLAFSGSVWVGAMLAAAISDAHTPRAPVTLDAQIMAFAGTHAVPGTRTLQTASSGAAGRYAVSSSPTVCCAVCARRGTLVRAGTLAHSRSRSSKRARRNHGPGTRQSAPDTQR